MGMGGEQWAWEEGGGHGRRVVGMGGEQWAWEEGGGHGRRVVGMEGEQWAWEEGGGHGRSSGHRRMVGMGVGLTWASLLASMGRCP